jgi:hypothetical protein
VAELTGLFGVDWATVFFVLFGISIAAMSLRRDVPGFRVGPFLVVPLISGVLLVVAVAVLRATDIRRFSPFLTRPITIAFVIAAAIVAVAIADLLFTRFAKILSRVWHGDDRRWRADASLAIFLGGAALLSALAMDRLGASTSIEPAAGGLGADASIVATYHLPEAPLDVALQSERDGYVSLGTTVAHFDLPEDPGGRLTLETVADGFTYSRGITIVGDVLVVADLGPLPCPDPIPVCKGFDVPGVEPLEGERMILEGSSGRLLAYDIGPDGGLTGERVILDDLPVANTEHGVNDVVTGPDGFLYVTIGNLDHLPPRIAATVDQPNKDLLGTVLRVSPDGDAVDVFARGLRNVYGLAFDEDGGLWGVDNDGETPTGWRAEEVLHIQRGRNYGYPSEGSFGALRVRDDFAVWHAPGPGSAGIVWADRVGLGPGLLIGSFGHIDGLRLTEAATGWVVSDRYSYAQMLDIPGFVSHLEPLGEGRIIASVMTYQATTTNGLYVLSLDA